MNILFNSRKTLKKHDYIKKKDRRKKGRNLAYSPFKLKLPDKLVITLLHYYIITSFFAVKNNN